MSNAPSYFQLLTPLTMLVFAVAFFSLHLLRRGAGESLWYSAAYFCAAVGFTISYFRAYLDVVSVSYISNFLFLLSPTMLVGGLAARYKKPLPFPGMVGLFATLLAGISWFLIFDDIYGRMLVVNSCVAAMFGIAAFVIGARRQKTIDRMIFAMMAMFAALYFARPAVVMLLATQPMTHENYAASAFAMTLEFMSTVCGLAFAVTLFFAQGMEAMAELASRSQTDFLSGLLNRRGFEERATHALAMRGRSAAPMALILADIDHFKSVNDHYGHAAGDEVIAAMGKLLEACGRASDICARIGGEEFCILLWGANGAMARAFAEGLRVRICHYRFESLPEGKHVTASFGISEFVGGETLRGALGRADAALYAAKATGRDRVVLAEAASQAPPSLPETLILKDAV